VPGGAYATRARYLKVRDRDSYEFAVVSAAAALAVEGGVIRAARLAVGGVGTKPWRLRDCEAALAGRRLDRAAFEAAAVLATRGAQPLHHNHYKVELLPRTIVRTLEMAGEVAWAPHISAPRRPGWTGAPRSPAPRTTPPTSTSRGSSTP
jgi:xanthine dehydrogenase YagS FAD-binding subunit